MTTRNRTGYATYPGERRPMPHGPNCNWIEELPVERRWPGWARALTYMICGAAAWMAVLAFAIGLAACLGIR